MTPRRAFLLVTIAALALRLFGVVYGPPLSLTDHEARGGLLWQATPTQVLGVRIVSALASSLAAGVLCGALLRSGRPTGALAAAALGVLSPLSVAAAREAGAGGAVELMCAMVCARLLLLDDLKARWRMLPSFAAACLLPTWTLGHPAPASPAFVRWRVLDSDTLAAVLAGSHHLGYALPLLAILGLAQREARALILPACLALMLAVAIPRGAPHHLSDLAGFNPVIIALAALFFERLARAEAERAAPFAARALLFVVLAVQSPVLLSDLISGLRLPWHAALDEAQGGLTAAERSDARIFTSLPIALDRLLPTPHAPILALPPTQAELDALLTGAHGPRVIVLAVAGGRAYGDCDPAAVDWIERHMLADHTFRARRFDLYRFEIRVYRR